MYFYFTSQITSKKKFLVFIRKEYIMELNRFKQLLESSMGNVRPLIMEQKDWSVISTNVLNTLGGKMGGQTDTTQFMNMLKTNVSTKQELELLKQSYNSKGDNYDDDVNSAIMNSPVQSQYTTWLNTLK